MSNMSSKDRLLAALNCRKADHLPVTTHHVMPSFLDKYMPGKTSDEFFEHFGLDAIRWVVPHRPDESKGEFYNPDQDEIGFLGSRLISSDTWQIKWKDVPGQKYKTIRYNMVTPGGTLTTVLQSNEHTSWVTEHLIKDKRDIELIAEYATAPKCDVNEVNQSAAEYGDRGLIRGHICSFDIFGQPGTWQDASCLFGIEPLIMATFDDPSWVHQFLEILCKRKEIFAASLAGANYDILELGGGDASSTVISPALFDEYVAPYDTRIIEVAHQAGQKIAYHTCGGMMPILEKIADMKPDAMETFTPVGMGADVDLAEARKRVPDDICMIGGFDQLHFFTECTVEETKAEVKRCFEAAGQQGSYILCPSDHFFDAEPELIKAFADAAKGCVY
jgi:uroporphyrinogen decarboxylase